MIAGIDFGAKFAGTTAIAFSVDGHTCTLQSKKQQSADDFLEKVIKEYQISTVFIDAPLSLPAVYNDDGCDFHYRSCDRQTGAMSPMFLGGLTARAMQLRSHLQKMDVACYETYPSFVVRSRFPKNPFYKKDIVQFLETNPFTDAVPCNWHQMDALICLYVGQLWQRNQHDSIGDQSEGVIIF